ncbi:MAG TPA: hypothetical protein VKW09_16005 [bacterium]|nr:hypothetical protein [bacterium]
MGTAQLALEKLCRRFDPGWEYGDDYPEKPKRVQWKTWERFCAAVEWWDAYLGADFVRMAQKLTAKGRR